MEFSKTAIKYLDSCHINFSNTFFQYRIKSHPEYPSLVSFTDTMDEVGLPYAAIVVEKGKYKELSYPIMAYGAFEDEEDFMIISSDEEFSKNASELLDKWNGVAIIIQKGQTFEYKDHDVFFKREKFETRSTLIGLFGILVVLSSFFVYNWNNSLYLLFLENIVGVFICSLIILQGMGKDIAITNHLCSSDGKSGCEKVMNSKLNTYFKDFGMGDAGLVYFLGMSFFLSFGSLSKEFSSSSPSLFLVPCILSVLISFVSLFYQWRVIKSWCRLCLLVIGIIWVQVITLFISNSSFDISVSISEILFFGSIFISPSILWVIIKPIILKLNDLEKTRIALSKWNRRPDLFLSILQNQKRINTTPWEHEIMLGKVGAPINITVAANPFCGPCARAHKELEDLRKKNPDLVSLTLRFVVNPNEGYDKRTEAFKHILDVYFNKTEAERAEVIDSWFELMDIERFNTKYKMSKMQSNWYPVLNNHYLWARDCGIYTTPTLYFNGFQLPTDYRVDDLKLLIPVMDEIIESVFAAKLS